MSKNQSFHKEFTLTIKGRSTNQFVPDLIEEMLLSYVNMVNRMYQQTDATLEVVDLKEK